MTEQKYTLKDGRTVTAHYNCYNVTSITKETFESLIEEANKSYEQAQQLQTIIENLEKIKEDARADEREKIAKAIHVDNTLCKDVKDILLHLLERYEKIANQMKGGTEDGTC